MACKLGIIPAAGKATRFGGIVKELLPLPDGRSLLEHAVSRLSFCDRVVVVTNHRKTEAHKRVLDDDIILQDQIGYELWGAIQTVYQTFDADRYYMTMPDTWIDPSAFDEVPNNSFALGYFFTMTPERFGVLKDGYVVDKDEEATRPAQAWGALAWDRHVCEIWDERKPENYTQAINLALSNVDWGTWQIGRYYDCANMQRYMELLDHLKGRKDE